MRHRSPLLGQSLGDLCVLLSCEWHPTENGDLTPFDVTRGSKRKVWWLGSACGHTWQATILSRSVNKQNCSVCAGQTILVGFNDLWTTALSIAQEWHPTRNGSLTPFDVTRGSRKKVWWLGRTCGHEWDAVVKNRTGRAAGCPVCDNKRILIGFNDLLTTHAIVGRQWHPTKNGSLLATGVTAGSSKKAWWLGICGHQWEAIIKDRAGKGSGCAVCAGWIVLIGFNDLATTNPLVARQWNYRKNNGLLPTQVTRGNDKKAWWVCTAGHEWEAVVKSRTLIGAGCPDCAKDRGCRTSLAEIALRHELGLLYSGTHLKDVNLPRTHGNRKWECDVLIEQPGGMKAVVEFDGHATHAERIELDRAKSADLRTQGYLVVRVRPGMPVTHEDDVQITRTQAHHSNAAWMAEQVAVRLTELGMAPNLTPVLVPAA